MAENGMSIDLNQVVQTALSDFENVQLVSEKNDKEDDRQVLADVKTSGENLNLVIKLGKGVNVAEGFQREAYVLNRVTPLFKDIQKYLRIQNPVQEFQKCYKVFNQEGTEIIVLDDIEKRGFEAVSGDLSEHNFKLILNTIAKFHALSFALRHIHKEKFDEVLSNCQVVTKTMLEEVAQFFDARLEKLKFSLKLRMRLDLLKNFEDALENFNGRSIIDILNQSVEHSVLVHGDYHQNNTLLKFAGQDKTRAIDVALTGFQASGLHSPVIDLSYYFFSSLGCGFFPNVSEFLKYYYEQLTSFLKELGCDVAQIYTFEKLQEHWRQYSFYGFCLSIAYLELGSINFEKHFRKENEESSEVEKPAVGAPNVASANAYRQKLEKIVEFFLEAQQEFY
uniref:Uncharacterized protein LOC114340993 n=1 Tax=Diabrotica virgifera virgifera TaxID=50390 RepID=A0A6P7GNJ9_DIAVI